MDKSVLGEDIDVLDLATKTKNALRRIKVHSVRELTLEDELKIRATRGIGSVGVANIKTALARYGLRLGMVRELLG